MSGFGVYQGLAIWLAFWTQRVLANWFGSLTCFKTQPKIATRWSELAAHDG
jgi:hypothetical protein